MQSVSFYLGENGLPMKAFRVHFYQADSTRHAPTTDLLTDKVFFVAPRSGEWYTLDLRPYAIAAPPAGFFVALEFGPAEGVAFSASLAEYTPQGLVLRPPFEYKKDGIWLYTSGKEWEVLHGHLRYRAMVKVEVEVLPKAHRHR